MTAKKSFTILVNIHLEHLIGEVSVLRKFVENKPEELTLKVEFGEEQAEGDGASEVFGGGGGGKAAC
jgi:hypothetical protein